DLNKIVVDQGSYFWHWGFITSPVSFLLFLVCMFAETNRAPFDLAEGESELVAGFHTEFNSAKFAAFFLAEYVSMFVLSSSCATVFFGGWQIPFVSTDFLNSIFPYDRITALVGHIALMIKACFFMFVYVWVRWTLPR